MRRHGGFDGCVLDGHAARHKRAGEHGTQVPAASSGSPAGACDWMQHPCTAVFRAGAMQTAVHGSRKAAGQGSPSPVLQQVVIKVWVEGQAHLLCSRGSRRGTWHGCECGSAATGGAGWGPGEAACRPLPGAQASSPQGRYFPLSTRCAKLARADCRASEAAGAPVRTPPGALGLVVT